MTNEEYIKIARQMAKNYLKVYDPLASTKELLENLLILLPAFEDKEPDMVVSCAVLPKESKDSSLSYKMGIVVKTGIAVSGSYRVSPKLEYSRLTKPFPKYKDSYEKRFDAECKSIYFALDSVRFMKHLVGTLEIRGIDFKICLNPKFDDSYHTMKLNELQTFFDTLPFNVRLVWRPYFFDKDSIKALELAGDANAP